MSILLENVKIEKSWKEALKDEFLSPYFENLKANLIDQNKHFILTAPHPSPLARGGFFGCKHFSKTNEILKKLGKSPIDWDLNNY